MADETTIRQPGQPDPSPEQANYNTPVHEGASAGINRKSGMNETAEKAPKGPQSEQKVTRSTEGSVEKTTERK